MSLRKVFDKKTLHILGLNSGTSADGLDLAALRFTPSKKGTRIRFLAGRSRQFDADLKRAILHVADCPKVTFLEVIQLDNMLGTFFGRAAASFMRSLSRTDTRIDAIASHGQTVAHLPHEIPVGSYRVRGTLQLGLAERISVLTGKPVVADFRQADVAIGGEGAPITVEAMRRLFASEKESRLIVNIGGMANYFYFPAGRGRGDVLAGDCGPGNVLCDILSTHLFRERHDRFGRRAASGTPSEILLSHLLSQPFFDGRTVSTGREDFGPALVARMARICKQHGISRVDMMSTAAELTVTSIAHRLQPLLARDPKIRNLYLTGGGTHNKFLVRRLQDRLPNIAVCSIRILGFDPDLVEAASFAVLGHETLRSRPVPTRRVGRRRRNLEPILGRIIQPPRRV